MTKHKRHDSAKQVQSRRYTAAAYGDLRERLARVAGDSATALSSASGALRRAGDGVTGFGAAAPEREGVRAGDGAATAAAALAGELDCEAADAEADLLGDVFWALEGDVSFALAGDEGTGSARSSISFRLPARPGDRVAEPGTEALEDAAPAVPRFGVVAALPVRRGEAAADAESTAATALPSSSGADAPAAELELAAVAVAAACRFSRSALSRASSPASMSRCFVLPISGS